MFLHPTELNWIELFLSQDVKKAVLEDMRAVGKEAGLKSFEQVTCLQPPNWSLQ